MDLSNLVGKILPPEKKQEENYLALEIGSENIKAAVWQQKKDTTKILGMGESSFAGDWERIAESAKEAISKAQETIISKISLNKVIFGLPSQFVENDEIKKPHISRLKDLTAKLSLNPVGFVVISEAISNLLQKREGVPQTFILVKVNKQEIVVSLFKAGKNMGESISSRTDKVALDLEAALEEFSEVEVLPSKIFIYDESGDLEKVKRELMEFSWQKKAPFLHLPKIEVLGKDDSIKAVVVAGASELAKKDSTLKEKIEEKKVEEEEIELQEPEELGFIEGEDILEKAKVIPALEKKVPQQGAEEEKIKEEEVGKEIKRSRLKIPSFKPPSFPSFEFNLQEKFKVILLAVVLLLLIFLGLSSPFLFFQKAKISVLVDPKVLEKEEELKLSSSIVSPDVESRLIPAKILETNVNQSKTTEATGKKTVGEKAKGEVVIYNKTKDEKTFEKGTVLTAPNKLKFLLDEEVTISSATESVEALTFGKAKAKITAEKIGPEGNLKSGQDFKVADFSESLYSAKNEIDFSQGSSREISVVSKGDQERPEASLSAELRNRAKEELLLRLEEKEKILEESIKGTVSQKQFDREVGAEAQNLTLNLSMHFQASVYKEEDLNKLVFELVKESVPENYQFVEKEITKKFSEAQFNEDGSITFKAHFKVNLIPEVEKEKLKRDLAGKPLSYTKEYLKGMANVVGYEVDFSSSLPFFKNRLPFLSRNLEIEIIPR